MKPKLSTNKRELQSGFSMVEIMVVLVIILVIAAMAVPSIGTAVTIYRLRGSVSGTAGLLQRARILAVRSNSIAITKMGAVNGANVAYIDFQLPPFAATNYDGNVDRGESLVQLQQGVQVATAPPVAFPATQLLGYPQAESGAIFNIAFNARGLPCFPNPAAGRPTLCSSGAISTIAGSTAGYLYYFRVNSIWATRWAALTITPAGRIRVWVLNGNTWS